MAQIRSWPRVTITVDGHPPSQPVQKLSIARGRQYEMDVDQAGTCTVELRNDDGSLTDATDLIGTQMSVSATWVDAPQDTFPPTFPPTFASQGTGSSWDLWTGFIDSVPWVTPTPLEGTAEIHGSDLLDRWSQRTLDALWHEGILATSPTWMWEGSQLAPIVGSDPTIRQQITTSGTAASGFNGTLLGAPAWTWNSSEQATIQGSAGASGIPASTDSAAGVDWCALIVARIANPATDCVPLLTLGGGGVPSICVYYKGGKIVVGYNVIQLGVQYLTAGTIAQAIDPTDSSALVVVAVSYSPQNCVLGVGAAKDTYYSSEVMTTVNLSVPILQAGQYNIGTPTNTQLSGSITTSGPTPTTYWSGAGDEIAAVAVWTGTTSVPAQNAWLQAALAQQRHKPLSATVVLEQIAGVLGGTWGYINESTPCLQPQLYQATATQLVQDLAQGLGARIFCDESGGVVYLGRDHELPGEIAPVIFGEGGIPYTGSPQFSLDLTHLANDVTVTGPSNDSHRVTDAASIDRFGPRALTVSTPAIAADQCASWLLDRYRAPTPRIATLTFIPSATPSMWPTLQVLHLHDSVLIRHRTAAGLYELPGHVDAISHDADAATGVWTTTVQVAPILATYWHLGDPTYGVLGSTTNLQWGTT